MLQVSTSTVGHAAPPNTGAQQDALAMAGPSEPSTTRDAPDPTVIPLVRRKTARGLFIAGSVVTGLGAVGASIGTVGWSRELAVDDCAQSDPERFSICLEGISAYVFGLGAVLPGGLLAAIGTPLASVGAYETGRLDAAQRRKQRVHRAVGWSLLGTGLAGSAAGFGLMFGTAYGDRPSLTRGGGILAAAAVPMTLAGVVTVSYTGGYRRQTRLSFTPQLNAAGFGLRVGGSF